MSTVPVRTLHFGTTQQKKVTMVDTPPQVVYTLSRSEFSSEEINMCWYNAEELEQVRSHRSAIVSMMQRNAEKNGPRKAIPYCTRGIEHLESEKRVQWHQTIRKTHTSSVLRATQRLPNCVDEEELAQISRASSRGCVALAIRMGAYDAAIVAHSSQKPMPIGNLVKMSTDRENASTEKGVSTGQTAIPSHKQVDRNHVQNDSILQPQVATQVTSLNVHSPKGLDEGILYKTQNASSTRKELPATPRLHGGQSSPAPVDTGPKTTKSKAEAPTIRLVQNHPTVERCCVSEPSLLEKSKQAASVDISKKSASPFFSVNKIRQRVMKVMLGKKIGDSSGIAMG